MPLPLAAVAAAPAVATGIRVAATVGRALLQGGKAVARNPVVNNPMTKMGAGEVARVEAGKTLDQMRANAAQLGAAQQPPSEFNFPL